jgi:hypothetical protein
MSKTVKLVITVPETHTELILKALGDAGAGVIGDYHHCSAVMKQVGYFIPGEGAHPAIGSVGKLEQVAESRIETPVLRERVRDVIAAVRKVHPYEEPVIDIYPLLDEEELLG